MLTELNLENEAKSSILDVVLNTFLTKLFPKYLHGRIIKILIKKIFRLLYFFPVDKVALGRNMLKIRKWVRAFSLKGNAQFLFLCNPKKSVNVYLMKTFKSTVTKR